MSHFTFKFKVYEFVIILLVCTSLVFVHEYILAWPYFRFS